MIAPLRLAISLVLSLLMWLPTVPGALAANEDPARLGGRYLLALLVARVGVGLVFGIVKAYATPPAVAAEPEEAAEQPATEPAPPARRREDPVPTPEADQQQALLDEALDEVEDTAALVP